MIRFCIYTSRKIDRLLIALILVAGLTLSGCHNGFYDKTANFSQDKTYQQTGDDRDFPERVVWPHTGSDLQPDPKVHYGMLNNGFRYVLMKNDTPKDRVSMHLYVQAGSLHENDNERGLAHFLEHLLFCGSTHFKPGELVKYFQSIGMRWGNDANAHTSFDRTVYDILLPRGNRENLENGLLVIQDYCEGALLLASEVERERKVVLAEKRTRDSASYRTFIAGLNFELPETRIARRLPIGTEKVLKAVDRAGLKQFYDTWYRPEMMILVMVGDFDMAVARPLIEKKFSNLEPRSDRRPLPEIGDVRHTGIKAFYHFEPEAGNTSVSIGKIAKKEHERDTLAMRKRRIHETIASRMMQNRLDLLVRQPDSPLTSVSIGSGRFLREIEYADLSAECSPANWKQTVSLLERELRKAIEFGFTRSELDRVKREMVSDLENNERKMSTRETNRLSRRMLSNLSKDKVFQSPQQQRSLFEPIIEAVGLRAVETAFRSTWAPDHRLLMVSGNLKLPTADTQPTDQIRTVFFNSRKIAVTRPVEQRTASFPYLSEPLERGDILKKEKMADTGIVKIDFTNGVRLNFKKTEFEAGQVRVNVAFGYGRSEEPQDRSGLAALSEAIINESGLGRLNRDELERSLAGKKVAVVFKVAADRFMFSGVANQKEAKTLFQLLYAHIVDPGYRQDAYTLVKERFEQEYRTLSSTVDGVMKLNGTRILAGGDSRFGMPDKKQFKGLTLADVKKWLGPVLSKSPLEVNVVGDIDLETVTALTGQYFGLLSRDRGVTPRRGSDSIHFPMGKQVNIKVKTKIPKGLLVVGLPTDDIWDINQTRRIAVMAEIMSERLREEIREKLGAVYSIFAYNHPSRAYARYGVLKIYAMVDPDQAMMIKEKIKKILAGMKEKKVTDSELRRALDPSLTRIKDLRQNNGYWLNTVMTGSRRHPQQLEWSRTILADYESINAEDILKVARQFLTPSNAAVLTIQPVSP
jgi:zinc protease